MACWRLVFMCGEIGGGVESGSRMVQYSLQMYMTTKWLRAESCQTPQMEGTSRGPWYAWLVPKWRGEDQMVGGCPRRRI